MSTRREFMVNTCRLDFSLAVAAVLCALLIPLPLIFLGSMNSHLGLVEEILPCLYSPYVENFFNFFKMCGTDYLTQNNPFISYLHGLSWLFGSMNKVVAVTWTYYLMAVQHCLFLFWGTFLLIHHSGCDKKVSWFVSAILCIIYWSYYGGHHCFDIGNWTPVLFLMAINIQYFTVLRHKSSKLLYLFLLNVLILSFFCYPYHQAPMFLLMAIAVYLIYPIRIWPFAVYVIMVLITWLFINFPHLLELALSSKDSSRWLYFGHPESNPLYNLIRGIYFQKINYIFLVLFFTIRGLNITKHVPRIFHWRYALSFLILLNAYKILESFSWLVFGKAQNFQYFDISQYALLILICHLMGPSISYLTEVGLLKIKHHVYLLVYGDSCNSGCGNS